MFTKNKSNIDLKIKNSNEKKEIISIVEHKDLLSDIIKSINDNNEKVQNLDQNKKNLYTEIWRFMANGCKQEIESFENRKVKYTRIHITVDKLIQIYNKNISELNHEIEELRSQTINTQDAVENINLILKNSGFNNFEIKEKEVINNISKYYLKRPNNNTDDHIFRTLSEGEKNFISFLYFYQLCLGTDDIKNNSSKKKIIVIDDPVSSLDSQSLFVVSSLIHQLILRKGDKKPEMKLLKNENISQIFIFTHNLYFYKEVSFDKRPICTDYWHYKIFKINNSTSISGQYNKPITNDYTLLWENIKKIKENIPQDSDLNVLIANSMRRIIESYVYFVGVGNNSWDSILNDDIQSPEYYLKCAFLAYINDDSHKVTVLDGLYYEKLSSLQPQLLFKVFKDIFIKIGSEHYEMMMDDKIADE